MPRRTKDPSVLAVETAIENHVAARIRLRRGLLGMSQSDLARALGITFQQVQKYERGSNRVSVGKLFRLADILDVPLSFFFDGLEMTGVENASKPTGVADEQSPLLGRRDLDLLRAWRQSPPAVAEAIAILLRAVSDEDRVGETTMESRPAAAARQEAVTKRRRRGAAWDPADIKSSGRPRKGA